MLDCKAFKVVFVICAYNGKDTEDVEIFPRQPTTATPVQFSRL